MVSREILPEQVRKQSPTSWDSGALSEHVRFRKRRKVRAIIERFDHRPMLTALLALSTTVLLVVVVALLLTLPPAASPSVDSGGGNPGAAAAPANLDAGGENYGWDVANK